MSNALTQAIASAQDGHFPVLGLQFSCAAWNEDIYLIAETEDIVSDGTTWRACACSWTRPIEGASGSYEMQVIVDGVDSVVVGLLRQADEDDADITVSWWQWARSEFWHQGESITLPVVEQTLSYRRLELLCSLGDMLRHPWPRQRYTTARYPALQYIR